jgi:phosphoribosylcarboxyaminoimidazole (NCAIR) mutase
VPVATMAIGKSGAINAAIFAAQILATSDPALRRRLQAFKQGLASKVLEKNRSLKSGGAQKS